MDNLKTIENDNLPSEREPFRDERGRYIKGAQSPNPKGRTPIKDGGKPNDPYNLRALIAEKADEVIASMLQQAIAGDVVAGDKLLQYILPKLSAVAVEANDAQSLPIMKVISAIHEANEDAKKIIDAQSAESVQKEHEQNED